MYMYVVYVVQVCGDVCMQPHPCTCIVCISVWHTNYVSEVINILPVFKKEVLQNACLWERWGEGGGVREGEREGGRRSEGGRERGREGGGGRERGREGGRQLHVHVLLMHTHALHM